MRRLPYFLILTVAGTAVGVGLALTLPPTFQAEARLVVESEQIPDELAASTVRTEASEQLQIIEQRILTRDNLLEMANRLNIYANREAEEGEPLRPDQIVSDLRERIDIRMRGGSRRGTVNATLVDVSFTASSSALAARVTNEVVTLMLEENVRMRTGVSGQTLEFFEQEVARLDEELARRGAQIIAFQESNKEALPDSLEFRRGQLAAAQERVLQLTREEAALLDRRQGLVTVFETTGSVGLLAPEARQNLTPTELKLRELEERLASSGAVLAFDNPRLRVLRAQIEALKEQVAAEAAATAGVTTADQKSDAGLSLYDLQLADLDNQLEFVVELRSEIEAEMELLLATIEATPANAISLDTLQRDFAATREQYDQAVANRARAETGDIIEALSKGERISVIEQAVPPENPTSPDRPRLAIAGLGVGMMMGLGLIVLLELLNTAIRRPQDIVQRLDVTPLGTLPFIRTRVDRVKRRLLLITILAFVGVAVFGGMWVIDNYVIPIDRLFEAILERLPNINFSIPAQDS
nr:lipopolysaccharide biosynthesis protein [Tateyamaria sp. ANG-S1]